MTPLGKINSWREKKKKKKNLKKTFVGKARGDKKRL